MTRVARLAGKRPVRVVVVAGLLMVVAAVFGARTPAVLHGGRDFEDPKSESALVRERLERAAGSGTEPGLIALMTPRAPVRSAAARAEVERIAATIARDPSVADVRTYYRSHDRAQISLDGRMTYVAATFRALDDIELADAASRLQDMLGRNETVRVGGRNLLGDAVSEQVAKDLGKAEALAFPFILALSLVFFRGLVAALMPLLVGAFTILGTFFGLRVVNEVLPLSVFVVNLVIALGLGLAIDYSLFIVSRYREELARAGSGPEAIRRTLQTAGRSVLFSALTVAAALAALAVFPLRFLYSMAVGGMLASLLAAAVALIVLPAVLTLLGPRINALAPRRLQRTRDRVAEGHPSGWWYRFSTAVMRRPAVTAAVSAAILLGAGSQFLRIGFTGVSADVLPKSAEARQVDTALRTQFPASPASPIVVGVDGTENDFPRITALRRDLARLPGVAAVSSPDYVGRRLWRLEAIPAAGPLDPGTRRLVGDMRRLQSRSIVGVTGQTAAFVDQQASLSDRLPVALAILCGTTLVILFLMTGSFVLPVKALVMNLLGLSATFGLLVLVFQDGRLEGLLGYTSQGALEATQPVLLFAVAFGLSTDYGVFLLSRIKEARDGGRDDRDAVATGLERTGRIVTAAAVLFTVAVGAFATSEIVFIKEVGVGMALAVLIDATIIRALLVPSLMALLGRFNWWSPSLLRRLHSRLRLGET